jgi:hypothetical protein
VKFLFAFSRTGWSRDKSRHLLRAYGDPASESDTEDDDEAKKEAKSRRLRLRVAKVLGITTAQLNFAQISMN